MNIKREMVMEYHDRFYRGENMVVVGAGALSHAQLLEYVERHLGAVKQQVPDGLEG